MAFDTESSCIFIVDRKAYEGFEARNESYQCKKDHIYDIIFKRNVLFSLCAPFSLIFIYKLSIIYICIGLA